MGGRGGGGGAGRGKEGRCRGDMAKTPLAATG